MSAKKIEQAVAAATAPLESAVTLAKAHVSSYTRKDGTFVKDHETSRQAAKPKQSGGGGSVHSDKAFSQIASAGGSNVTTTSDYINYYHRGVSKRLAHTMTPDGHRYVDESELQKHLSDLRGQTGGAHEEKAPPSASRKTKPKPAAAVESKNKEWGFHGEARTAHLAQKHGGDHWPEKSTGDDYTEAEKAAGEKFAAAADHLVKEGHFKNHDEARDYLDSRHGRHLHDAAYPHGDISKVSWLAKDVGHYKRNNGALFNESAASKRVR